MPDGAPPPPGLDEFALALRYLDGYTNRGVVPGLERIRWMCAELGHPEQIAPAVHLTGTNGKGSTARLLAALLVGAGRTPGLYTSPHLEDITERFVIGERQIDHLVFAQLMRRLTPLFDRVTGAVSAGPTHFEILTTIGLLAFAEQGVDSLVIEVGLGGRWDTTNVVDGAVGVITNVGVDHVGYLGHRREEQAFEKSGIIKPGATAIIGETDDDIVKVITERCAQVGASIWRAGLDFGITADRRSDEGRTVTIRTPGAIYQELTVPSHGAHQARNAACALAAAEAFLGYPLPEEIVRTAWSRVTNPGRLEIFAGTPLVVLDVAHNPHGMSALVLALQEMFPGRAWVVAMGVSPDKDAQAMLELLTPNTRALVTTEALSGQSMPADLLSKLAVTARQRDVTVVTDPINAVEAACRLAHPDDVVVLTGSHYWLGEVRSILLK